MRVLHLPNNIASQPALISSALRGAGIDARAVTCNNAVIQTADGTETHLVRSLRRHPWRGTHERLRWWWAVWRAILWADIVHWHFDSRAIPGDLDLRLAARRRKGRVVEFWGSDIRDPQLAAIDNPHLARLTTTTERAYPISTSRSRRAQRRFARHGFACIIPGPELGRYLVPGLWPTIHRSEAVVALSELAPAPPDAARARPLVVHVPSQPIVKGTPRVLAVVARLQTRLAFDFRLIHDVPRAEALQLMRQADIVLDQFVIGSFGLVSLEAMALGKPAVCYLTAAVRSGCPPDLPIVSADADELEPVLASLLGDGDRRRAIGLQGPPYVERHHDARVVARRLVAVYEEEIRRARRGAP